MLQIFADDLGLGKSRTVRRRLHLRWRPVFFGNFSHRHGAQLHSHENASRLPKCLSVTSASVPTEQLSFHRLQILGILRRKSFAKGVFCPRRPATPSARLALFWPSVSS